MREKVVVLNSGGFDSVTLMHYVKNTYDQDIISVFFNYGQRNLEQERQYSYVTALKVGAELIEVDLPDFTWSKNSVTHTHLEENKNTAYVPMRNLVFLSYALSIAEAQLATRIYAAFIKDGTYNDTNKTFQKDLRRLFKNSTGIKLDFPFHDLNKDDIADYAWGYGIMPEDYFSCNHPKHGSPCGECDDCKALVPIEKHLMSQQLPIYKWIRNGFNYSDEFAESYMNNGLVELRVHNNNVCNFKCSHCYYGFEDAYRPELTNEEWFRVFDQALEMGIKQFHFCGKESVLTSNLWELAAYLKTKGARYDIVTNGSTIHKHIDKIKELGFYRVCVSVDSLGALTIRDLPTAEGAVKTLRENGIPVTVFIDCHKSNYRQVNDIVATMIDKYNVNNFYVRPVMYHGAAKDIVPLILKPEEWYEVIEQMFDLSFDFPEETTAVLFQPSSMLESLYKQPDKFPLVEMGVNFITESGTMFLNENLRFFIDFFQANLYNQATVTSDGYVVGLGTDMSNPKYYEKSPGNVLDAPLKELIQKGRKEHLAWMKNAVCNPHCSLCRHGHSKNDFYCYSEIFENPS